MLSRIFDRLQAQMLNPCSCVHYIAVSSVDITSQLPKHLMCQLHLFFTLGALLRTEKPVSLWVPSCERRSPRRVAIHAGFALFAPGLELVVSLSLLTMDDRDVTDPERSGDCTGRTTPSP